MSHYPKGYLLRGAEANGLPNASRQMIPEKRRRFRNGAFNRRRASHRVLKIGDSGAAGLARIDVARTPPIEGSLDAFHELRRG